MKIRYRIKQIGDTFYCQKKTLFWKNISVLCCSYHHYDRYPSLYNNKRYLTFDNLYKAKIGLKNYIQNYLQPFFVKGHLIQSYYNVSSDNYLYISCKNHELFSDVSEIIVERISEYEYERKKLKEHSKKVTIHEYSEKD